MIPACIQRKESLNSFNAINYTAGSAAKRNDFLRCYNKPENKYSNTLYG